MNEPLTDPNEALEATTTAITTSAPTEETFPKEPRPDDSPRPSSKPHRETIPSPISGVQAEPSMEEDHQLSPPPAEQNISDFIQVTLHDNNECSEPNIFDILDDD